MAKTVGDFLTNRKFKKFKLVAGASGKKRRMCGMCSVDFSELDHAEELCGHLVFLCGKLPEISEPLLIKKLADARVAALLLDMNNAALLDEYKKAADIYALPLLTADSDPFGDDFLAEFASFLWDISNVGSSPLCYSDIAVELLDSANMMALMQRLEDFLGYSAAFRDVILNRTLTASKDRQFSEMVKTYPLRELQRMFYCQGVVNEGFRAGYLFFADKVKPEQLSIINTALLGLRIHLKKNNQERLARKKLSFNFFTSLFEEKISDHSALIEKLRSAGLRKDSHCLAVVIKPVEHMILDCDDLKYMMAIDTIEKKISSLFEDVFLMTYKNFIVCIAMPSNGQKEERIMERLRHAVHLSVGEMRKISQRGYYIGCGSMKHSLALLSDSAAEAMKAVQYSEISAIVDSPVFWKDLHSYQIISSIATFSESKKLYRRILGRLLDHDRDHDGELIDTLMALERNNWNVRRAAQEMLFHPNTIKYRMRKISELLDGSIEESQFKFDLLMALRLHILYKFDRDVWTGEGLHDD